jgi:hypothetical protein
MDNNSGTANIPAPDDMYVVGSEPKGGRRARYPFKTMEVGEHRDCPLDPLRVSKHRGQIMSAIRQTQYRWRKRQFGVKDITEKDDPNVKTLTIRVWRLEDIDSNRPI